MSKIKKKRMGAGWIILIVLLVLLIVLAAAAALFFWRFYSLSNYRSDSAVTADASETLINPSLVTESTGLTDSELAEIQTTTNLEGGDIELPDNKDVYNLLLVGVDRRDSSWNGNSDSMIIFTINKKTRELHMTSMMRDLYADIPNVGVRKLNNAYAVGGGPLLVQTIESNYKVRIDNYAAVDFVSMVKIIDAMGGVTLTISDEEAQTADGYIRDMCQLQNVSPEGHLFGSGGTFECDGFMAVGYARIRYVGNSDYERTERQRVVMTQLVDKVRGMSAVQLNDLATEILPYITHNIPSMTLLSLLTQAPSMMEWGLAESRVPYDGMYATRGEILVPDMASTISKLQNEIYNQ